MARKVELTWQAGGDGRSGRWRKKFRGRTYYFDGGRGKSDRQAYAIALKDWNELRQKIQDLDEKPHESDYFEVLREWRAARDWASQNADKTAFESSRGKIRELEARLAGKQPPPITQNDRFESQFQIPILDLTPFLATKEDIANLSTLDLSHLHKSLGPNREITPTQSEKDLFDGSPFRIAKEIWRDRITTQLRLQDEAAGDKSVDGNIERFLSQKRAQVTGGELSAGRCANLALHLTAFRDFVGGGNPVSAITSRVMTDFRSDLLDRKTRGEFSSAYAKNRLDTSTQFTRWLWREETLADLPRVIESRSFSINAATAPIKTFTADEIKALLAASEGQNKLCLLLALNTGMTQRDIADLRPEEVDWESGVIRRKRSKTRQHKNVPEVAYQLWPETFSLLKKCRRLDCPQVLANENGAPLLVSTLKADGKLHKVDNVHCNFSRCCRRVKITGRPFKSLRKTAATLLRGNATFSGLESVFLGHAPRSIADRHYAGVPHELLGQAINWLATQFGLDAATNPASTDKAKQKTNRSSSSKRRSAASTPRSTAKRASLTN